MMSNWKDKYIRDLSETGKSKETAIFQLIPRLEHQYADNFKMVDKWERVHSYKSHISTGDFAILWNGESDKSIKKIMKFVSSLLKQSDKGGN